MAGGLEEKKLLPRRGSAGMRDVTRWPDQTADGPSCLEEAPGCWGAVGQSLSLDSRQLAWAAWSREMELS